MTEGLAFSLDRTDEVDVGKPPYQLGQATCEERRVFDKQHAEGRIARHHDLTPPVFSCSHMIGRLRHRPLQATIVPRCVKKMPVWTLRVCQWPPTRQSHCLLDQSVTQRVRRQVGIGVQIHLLEHPGPVSADRLHADEELLRNLGHRASYGQLAQDLEFPLRK